MYSIKNMPVYNAEKIYINDALWGYNSYKSEVFAQISRDSEGFIIKFTVGEKNPQRDYTKHLDPVNLDSCVEFFANFNPDKDNHYFNFETNANGVMNVGFRTDRHDGQLLTEEEIESFNITTVIFDDHWEVSYKIGYDFLLKYIPDFDISKCNKIKCNLFKCGDETETPHFLCWSHIDGDAEDFHQSAYFKEMSVI